MQEFEQPIPQPKLNIVARTRTNLLAWRGQFSPQLIEVILSHYCPHNSIILDPFVGSGTVLLEAGSHSLEAYGFDLNPAAFLLSKIYEFIPYRQRQEVIKRVRYFIDSEFPLKLFEPSEPICDLPQKVNKIGGELNDLEKRLFDALIVTLDVANNSITNDLVRSKFIRLASLVENLPYSERRISVELADARSLPLENDRVDFIVTSPPYINVFNYHQNYRKSAEILGWDILKIAKSEIGSNRANRGNRFYTVVQYCLDMGDTLREMSRVTKKGGKVVLVIGHQSNVLGVPFYNADIIEKIGIRANIFRSVLRQQREFKNKFGKIIREDIINFVNLKNRNSQERVAQVAKEVAFDVLSSGLSLVLSKNRECLEAVIDKVQEIEGTPILENSPNIDRSLLSV